MDEARALEVIRPLSEGIDPGTGEILPDAHLMQKPDVIRALHDAMAALEMSRERKQRQRNLPGKAGASWSATEDEQLGAGFDGGVPVAELAKTHERTRSAIHARLVKLGKLDPAGMPERAQEQWRHGIPV